MSNNDLISREALKTALHNFFDGKVIDEPAYILRDVFSYIDNAPTVSKKDLQKIFYETAEKPELKEVIAYECGKASAKMENDTKQ